MKSSTGLALHFMRTGLPRRSWACPAALRGVLKGEGAAETTAPKCTKNIIRTNVTGDAMGLLLRPHGHRSSVALQSVPPWRATYQELRAHVIMCSSAQLASDAPLYATGCLRTPSAPPHRVARSPRAAYKGWSPTSWTRSTCEYVNCVVSYNAQPCCTRGGYGDPEKRRNNRTKAIHTR